MASTPRASNFDIIEVCINDNPDCCSVLEYENPDCSNDMECNISDVFAEAGECNDDGGFFVDIEFDVQNPGTNGFTISGNGVIYGDDFEYGETFYSIGPLLGDCSTIYEFVIIDNEFPDCQDFFEFVEPICCDGECELSSPQVYDIECENDSTYALVLDFNYANVDNAFFDVWVNNDYEGFYEFSDLPIIIEGITPRDVDEDIIQVCVNDNDECCFVIEYDNPDCELLDNVDDLLELGISYDYNNGYLYIQNDYTNPIQADIYSIHGQKITKTYNLEDQILIDLNAQASNILILRIKADKRVLTVKFAHWR